MGAGAARSDAQSDHGGSVGGRSTRAYLLALSLVLVLPVAAVSLWLALGLQRSEQERFERLGHEAVRTSALAVQLEIRGVTTTMELLAASPALRAGDLSAFHREAQAAAGIEQAIIALRDADSRHLLNTARPFGAPLPPATPLLDIDRQVLREGNPAISDLFAGPLDGRPLVAVVVPVRRDGAVVGLLSAALPPERLRPALRANSGALWRTGIIGRDKVAITRARDPDIGGQRPPAIGRASSDADEGYFEMTSAEGEPSAVAFAKTPWGWTVLAVASIGEYRAAQRQRLGLAALASFGLVLAGLGLAFALAKRISRPILALEAAGRNLSTGDPVIFAQSSNLEANSVARSLAAASEALRARDAALAASNALYKDLFDGIDEAFCILELVRDAAGRAVDYRYVEANPAFRRLTELGDVAGRLRSETGPGGDIWGLDILDRVARTGQNARFQVRLSSNGRWFDSHATRLSGLTDQVAVISDDITERKQAETTRELLINELNHRVKNTLTAVQSMAMHSLRDAATLEEGRAAFERRLMALSRAHNILTKQNWDRADLREIAAESVLPLAGDAARVHLDGPIVKLPPNPALTLAMVLHELAANALKHGALSAQSGTVALSWSAEPDRLDLEWRESGGPPPAQPARRGFGTKLIQRSLDGNLGGEVAMSFESSGLVCRLSLPLKSSGPVDAAAAT